MLISRQIISDEQECYEELACAIVKQAAEDYLEARKNLYFEALMREPNAEKIRKLKYEKRRIVEFFHSEWYRRLVKIDGDEFLRRLDNKFEEQKANNFEK